MLLTVTDIMLASKLS